MLELKILAANILLPTVLLATVLLAIRGIKHRKERAKVTTERRAPRTGERSASTLVVAACATAIWLAFGLRVSFSLWPEDAWARLPQSVGIVGIGSALALWLTPKNTLSQILGWTIRLGFLIWAAKVVIPTGEAWEFLQPTQNIWWAVLVISPAISWLFVDRLPSRAAAAFGFGSIACVAAGALLSSEFLRVTEPLLAVASVLGCASIATWGDEDSRLLSAVYGPCIFGLGMAVASAQFNSYAGKPDALSWLAMSTPSLAALILWILGGSKQTSKPTWQTLATTLIVCVVMAACVIAWILLIGESAGDEDWS